MAFLPASSRTDSSVIFSCRVCWAVICRCELLEVDRLQVALGAPARRRQPHEGRVQLRQLLQLGLQQDRLERRGCSACRARSRGAARRAPWPAATRAPSSSAISFSTRSRSSFSRALPRALAHRALEGLQVGPEHQPQRLDPQRAQADQPVAGQRRRRRRPAQQGEVVDVEEGGLQVVGRAAFSPWLQSPTRMLPCTFDCWSRSSTWFSTRLNSSLCLTDASREVKNGTSMRCSTFAGRCESTKMTSAR